jgi:hypothetical protein
MLKDKLAEFEEAMRERGPGWSERVEWTVTCGRYEENVPGPAPQPSALFLFLDPFGYSHAPMELTQDLVQQPKSDTLVFLPLSFVHRFVDREGQDRALDRFFGTRAWRDVPNGDGRPAALLELFQAQLRAAGLDYVLPFRLLPEERANSYWIVGGSGHPSGFESIKEGFWAVDPRNGQEYRAPLSAAAGQESLKIEEERPEPNTEPLLALLREHFGTEPFTVEQAIDFTKQTRFLKTHLKQKTLAKAEKAKPPKLLVERPSGALQFKEGKGITLRFP